MLKLHVCRTEIKSNVSAIVTVEQRQSINNHPIKEYGPTRRLNLKYGIKTTSPGFGITLKSGQYKMNHSPSLKQVVVSLLWYYAIMFLMQMGKHSPDRRHIASRFGNCRDFLHRTQDN